MNRAHFCIALIAILMFGCLNTTNASARRRRYIRPLTQVIKPAKIERCEGAWLPLSTYQALRKRQLNKTSKTTERIGQAIYRAVHAKGGFDVDATLHIELQEDGWHTLPVLKANYPLYSAILDGKPAKLLQATPKHPMLRLVIQNKGQHTLRLRFFVPRGAGPDPQVKLEFAPSTSTFFEAHFDSLHYRPSLNGGFLTRLVKSKGKIVLKAQLIASQKVATLRWWRSEQTQKKKHKASTKRSRLYARTYSLLSVGKGGQDLFFTVRYTIVHAPREQFQFVIPKGLLIRQVHGLGLRDYSFSKRPDGTQLLDILLVEPVTERYELSLLAELQQDGKDVLLRLPRPLAVQREQGHLGVEVLSNDEIKISANGAVNIDVQELPREISKGTTRPILRAYRYTKRPTSWKLHVRRYQNVAIPASMIDRAIYTSVSNHKGKTWVQASYQVRNTFKQFIAIKLPKGGALQSAFVDRKPVKPARDEKGRVLLPLKRSGTTSGNNFEVEVVYSLNTKAFKGQSLHQANLPTVDLWISELQWIMYIPEGRVSWRKSSLGRENPRGYSSWNKVNFSTDIQRRQSWRRHPHTKAAHRNIPTGGNTQSTGTLPVRIKLPRWGRRYSFRRYHLAPQSSTVLQFEHQLPWMGTLGFGFFFFAGLCLGFALTLHTLRKKPLTGLVILPLVFAGLSAFAGRQLLSMFPFQLIVLGALGGLILATLLNLMMNMDETRHDQPAPT